MTVPSSSWSCAVTALISAWMGYPWIRGTLLSDALKAFRGKSLDDPITALLEPLYVIRVTIAI